MRLWQKYRPTSLDDIVGQPPVKFLKRIARLPVSCCVLLEGTAGTGKTAAALALAADLGVDDEAIGGGLMIRNASDLTADAVRDLWRRLWQTPLVGSPWKLLVIEELEMLPSATVQRLMKTKLDHTELPAKCIVVATSNSVAGLDEAMLERFDRYTFNGGVDLARAAGPVLRDVWEREVGMGVELPETWVNWGWQGERWSFRKALSAMGDAIARRECVA